MEARTGSGRAPCGPGAGPGSVGGGVRPTGARPRSPGPGPGRSGRRGSGRPACGSCGGGRTSPSSPRASRRSGPGPAATASGTRRSLQAGPALVPGVGDPGRQPDRARGRRRPSPGRPCARPPVTPTSTAIRSPAADIVGESPTRPGTTRVALGPRSVGSATNSTRWPDFSATRPLTAVTWTKTSSRNSGDRMNPNPLRRSNETTTPLAMAGSAPPMAARRKRAIVAATAPVGERGRPGPFRSPGGPDVCGEAGRAVVSEPIGASRLSSPRPPDPTPRATLAMANPHSSPESSPVPPGAGPRPDQGVLAAPAAAVLQLHDRLCRPLQRGDRLADDEAGPARASTTRSSASAAGSSSSATSCWRSPGP